jgi:Tol biopolymer transport system component
MKTQTKTFLVFILIILIAGSAIYLYGKNKTHKDSDRVSVTPTTTDNTLKESATNKINVTGSIVYTATSSDNTDIYSITLMDGTKKKIFTDQDENSKITQMQSITKDGKSILTTLVSKSDDTDSSLWFINTSKGEKNKLIDNFASSSAPITSGDGKKIAYSLFSNVERDYGFTLLVSDISGLNKVKIDNDSFAMSLAAFSPSNDYLIYVKNVENNTKSTIYKSKIDGTQTKEIYQSNNKEIIYSLDWSNDVIAFSKGPMGNNNLNKAEIFTISDDGKNLSYLAITYEENPKNASKTGEIHILNLEDNQDSNLGQETDRIIGWIP